MARKRKNGQGTVRLRSDGRWEGRHIVGYDENGKAKQKSVLAKTKAECVEKLKKLQEEYTEVAPFKVKPDMRFGDWMNYWYENHCKPSIRPTTQKGYEEWIYVHAIPGLGHIPLNKLTQADCQKFLNEMKANGRKAYRDTKGPEMAERSVRSCYPAAGAERNEGAVQRRNSAISDTGQSGGDVRTLPAGADHRTSPG